MFIEYLNQDTEKLQEFIDIIFAHKKNTPEYKFNYDVSHLFNRHALNGKLCLNFVDNKVILSDFSISVNGDTSSYNKQWIKFLKSTFGKDFKKAYNEHKQEIYYSCENKQSKKIYEEELNNEII